MNITDNEVRTATRIWYQDDEYEPGPRELAEMRTVLESVHGPSSAESQTPKQPEPGPFALSSEEESAVLDCEGTGQPARVRRVAKLVRRAQSILTAPGCSIEWHHKAYAYSPGPFELSGSERGALSLAARGHFDNGTVGSLTRALDRACRTLAPKQPERVWLSDRDEVKPEDYSEEQLKAVRVELWEAHGEAEVGEGWPSDERIRKLLAAANVPAQPAQTVSGKVLADLHDQLIAANKRIAELDAQLGEAQNGYNDHVNLSNEYKARIAELEAQLAAQPSVELLSEAARRDLDHVQLWCSPSSPSYRLATELARRCPVPEPKQRTPSELRKIILRGWSSMDNEESVAEALNELVRQAEASK